MTSTDQIRDSLMRIKHSQAELLRELRTQHDALQGYISQNQNLSEKYKGKSIYETPQRQYNSFQSSLQLSKSQGNSPNFHNLIYNSTSTGAEDIIQNNYKKIEDLLIKQRRLYEQNHALQQQNQSLNQDYRTIKKHYYQLKQQSKNNIIIFNYLFNDMIYNSFKDFLLQVPNKLIGQRGKKGWKKFKLEHPRLFQVIGNNQYQISEQAEKSIEKIYGLLDQDFKINSVKQKQEEIEELKQKITHLINMNSQVTKNKEQMMQIEQKRIILLQKQNYKLIQSVKSLQLELNNKNIYNLDQVKKLQNVIFGLEKQVVSLRLTLQQKEQNFQNYKNKIAQLKKQLSINILSLEEANTQLNNLKIKLKEKQDQYNSQITLNKTQNLFIQKQNRQISQLRLQIPLLQRQQNRSQSEHRFHMQNQNLIRQLTALRAEFQRNKQLSQRQIDSLVAHNKEIKNQHSLLIKSQQNARLNEIRYRELVAAKQTQMKMTTSIDHLWNVKEIEYGNIVNILASLK